ncbi:MAG: hypothetical protein OXJ54_09645 [Gemmatimonadetes bacterium]|nr:hypothetical protein [Candidatus Palauibacter rhopaloidicola]
MAASIAIHAFVFSVVMVPSAETSRRAGTVPDSPGRPTSSDALSGIRVIRIVAEPVAQRRSHESDARPESPEPATEQPVAEPSAPEMEYAAETIEGEPSRPDRIEPAARLRPRFTNPALWREIRGARADTEWTSGMLLRDRVDGGGSRYTPPDAWAFDTWTTRDAAGRLWGVAPGSIYLAGFAIRTCGGRFDASNCGFGLPGWKRLQYQRSIQAAMEIENQQRWRGIMERDRAIRERRGAERRWKTDSIPGISDAD